MRRMVSIVTVALMSVTGLVIASAPLRASGLVANGRIAFGEEGSDDILVVTSNPDGTHRQELIPNFGCLSWSPDGTKLLVCVPDDRGLARPATIDADGTDFKILDNPDPRLNLFCWSWSPDGERLACEGGEDPPSARDGLYTVRSSDGGGLFRLTVRLNFCCPFIPGDAAPGAYSPDGKQILFTRSNASEQYAVFVVNTDGTGIRQITPWGLGGGGGRWSRDGNWIVFSVTSEFHHFRGALFLVHPDGTGLHKIDVETGGSQYFAKEPTWSPDDTRILFVMYLGSNGGQPDLFTMNPNGSHLIQVTNTPITETTPSWGTHPLAT